MNLTSEPWGPLALLCISGGDRAVLYCPTLMCVGDLAQVLMSQIITPTPSLWPSSLSLSI